MADNRQHGIEAGQAVYSPAVLRLYDVVVHGLSNHLLWRCPTRTLRALYDRNVSARHIDIGVGTGYFLDKARWPVANPEITLVDLNPNSLASAARRIARFDPRTVRANALEALSGLDGAFASAGLCYLLHCLPGTLATKAAVFDNLMPLLAPGARVFGATIVQGDAPRSPPARKLMDAYNAKGIFSNRDDRIEDLETALARRFSEVRLRLIGSVAVFEARHR